ncbi:MAG: N-acetylmuramoyl-L-alanine amidase [Flavobacteriales bacterium]|nr:N-acetylmuramoyl-L-alanine amidase [Flavobacteriales bacterium]
MRTKLVYRLAVVAALLALPARSMPQGTADPNKIDVVAIDAGHGGKDPGNLGTGRYKTTEKDVALKVALLVGKYIKQAFPDVKVIYTRDDDHFVELNERCRIANSNKADVFISMHNANDSRRKAADLCDGVCIRPGANMRVAQKENRRSHLWKGHELKYDS